MYVKVPHSAQQHFEFIEIGKVLIFPSLFSSFVNFITRLTTFPALS
jgi:hypothetical protein